MLQGERRLAACEAHVAVDIADARIAERDGEVPFPAGIARVPGDRLLDGQIADDSIVFHLYGHVAGEQGGQVGQVLAGQVGMRGAVIAGMEHTLLDKQRGPARVGFLRGDSLFAACQCDRGLIKPVAEVSLMIGRMGQMHANRRGAIRTGFEQIPFCILRRGSCHGIGGMIDNALYGGEGGAIVCVFDLPPLEVFVGLGLCGIELGHDLVQGGVHRVLGSKLRHGVHQAAHAPLHADSVLLRSGVGVYAGVVDDDLDLGRVCGVAFGGGGFHKVVGAVGNGGEGCHALGGNLSPRFHVVD